MEQLTLTLTPTDKDSLLKIWIGGNVHDVVFGGLVWLREWVVGVAADTRESRL